MDNILEIKSISKKYKKSKYIANKSISATFKSGEIVALIGHNGAGKTTFVNQIIGITKPDEGDICYSGISFVRNPKIAREQVSIMPQLHAPLSGVTVSQAISSIMRIRGVSKNEEKILLSKILRELEIEDWKDTAGDKLSGGLRRLTSFAMTVAKPSNIILLDEPTNDVDPIRRKLMWNYLKKLSANGHIIIVITHNLLEVEQYADRYIKLEQGEIIKDDSTYNVNEQFFANLLIIDTNDKELMNSNNIPKVISIKPIDVGRFSITVSLEQMDLVLQWLLMMMKEKKITNYKLSPSSLESSYGGTNNV